MYGISRQIRIWSTNGDLVNKKSTKLGKNSYGNPYEFALEKNQGKNDMVPPMKFLREK